MSKTRASQWWDEAGAYPTEDALARLKQLEDPAEALDFARELWHQTYGEASERLRLDEQLIVQPHLATTPVKFLRLATGGWSGNESIISALRANHLTWLTTWQLSARGGLHIFRYPRNNNAT